MNEAGREKPPGGLELWAWLFMRASGVVLLFLALGHLAIMHLINSIHVIDFDFVADRYQTPFWRVYDSLLLSLALIHGLNGLRTMIDDYIRAPRWRAVSLGSLYVLGAVFLTLGLAVIVAFNPEGMR